MSGDKKKKPEADEPKADGVEIVSGSKPPHQLVTMTIAELSQSKADYNPRQINPHDYESLRQSLARFGVVEPLVWNARTKRLVGGHQRVDALESLGVKDAPVVVVDLPENEEKALNLALNRISGEWRWDAVTSLLRTMDDDMRRLSGFNESEITGLLRGIAPDGTGAAPPEDFAKVDEGIQTEHECPRCKYRWSGGTAPAEG